MRAPAPVVLLPLLLLLQLLQPAAPRIWGEEPAQDPEAGALIGLGLEQAFARLGAPSEVLALRGEAAEQDDVIFYYAGRHLYLFWFQNRVWQVRYDRRHTGAPFSLSMGASRQRVIEVLGSPLAELPEGSGASALVYQLEDRGYPVRLRLYFEDDHLVDLYCYRADL